MYTTLTDRDGQQTLTHTVRSVIDVAANGSAPMTACT
jgi:hypothetical protein